MKKSNHAIVDDKIVDLTMVREPLSQRDNRLTGIICSEESQIETNNLQQKNNVSFKADKSTTEVEFKELKDTTVQYFYDRTEEFELNVSDFNPSLGVNKQKENNKTPFLMYVFAALMTLIICLPGAFYPLISGIVIIILCPVLGGMSGGLSGTLAVLLWGATYIALSFSTLNALSIYFIGLAALLLFVAIASVFFNKFERISKE